MLIATLFFKICFLNAFGPMVFSKEQKSQAAILQIDMKLVGQIERQPLHC